MFPTIFPPILPTPNNVMKNDFICHSKSWSNLILASCILLFWYLLCSTNFHSSSSQQLLEHKYCDWEILHWLFSWQFHSDWCSHNSICWLGLKWILFSWCLIKSFCCLLLRWVVNIQHNMIFIDWLAPSFASLLLHTLFMRFIIGKTSSQSLLSLLSSSPSCTSIWHCRWLYSSICMLIRHFWDFL